MLVLFRFFRFGLVLVDRAIRVVGRRIERIQLQRLFLRRRRTWLRLPRYEELVNDLVHLVADLLKLLACYNFV